MDALEVVEEQLKTKNQRGASSEITRAGALFYKYSGMTREGSLKERKDLYNRKKEMCKKTKKVEEKILGIYNISDYLKNSPVLNLTMCDDYCNSAYGIWEDNSRKLVSGKNEKRKTQM